MNHRIGKACLITLSLCFSTGLAQANTTKFDAAAKPASSSQTTKTANKNDTIKAVDINSASKAELKTLPGIDDALAEKIIAGRPYPSKGFLVSRKIIPEGHYIQIKKQIIAMQK